MSRTRTLLLLALVAGCTGPAPAPPVAKTAPTYGRPPGAKTPATVGTPNPAPTDDVTPALAAANAFLAGVATGSPDVGALTPAFRAVLAGGDSPRADWLAEQFLKGFAGKPLTVGSGYELADGTVLAVGDAVVRVQAGRVGGFHPRPAAAPPVVVPGEDIPARLAAVTFLDTAVAGQVRLAEAALSAAGRARVAPPLGADPLGFSRGLLTTRLRGFAGGATGYTLTTSSGTATGELAGPGGRRRFTLTLADTPDGPRVDDFQPR
jgi:hypothetical protein